MIGGNKKEIGNGSGNIQADGNVEINNNYYTTAQDEELTQTAIDEIFQFVITNAKSETAFEKAKPEKHLKTIRKIKLNFKKTSDANSVKQRFTYAYQKISLIEKKFAEFDSADQNDIHSFIYNLYTENKTAGMSNILNLNKLVQSLIPPKKERNPHFVNCSNAFVLFFFDDCTIFEKTRQEKKEAKNLFQ